MRRLLAGFTLLLLACRCLAGAAAAPLPDAPPPVLLGKTPSGLPVSLADLRGKVVLVTFWSSRCDACVDKLREMRANIDGWKDQPFIVVAVSQDPTRDSAAQYEQLLQAFGFSSAQLRVVWRNDASYRDSFGALDARVPTNIVVDKLGRLRLRQVGALPLSAWDTIADMVLAE